MVESLAKVRVTSAPLSGRRYVPTGKTLPNNTIMKPTTNNFMEDKETESMLGLQPK